MSTSVAAVVRGFRDHDPRVPSGRGRAEPRRVGCARAAPPRGDRPARAAGGWVPAPRRQARVARPSPRARTGRRASHHGAHVAATAGRRDRRALRPAGHRGDRREQPTRSPLRLSPCRRTSGPCRIAVAAGRAFTFSYTDNVEALEAAGAEIVPFDPLHDPALPESIDGLVIGGGFPEVYGEELAANVALLADVADRIGAGLPTWAECGGLLWLARELDGRPMVGAVPARARLGDRLVLGLSARPNDHGQPARAGGHDHARPRVPLLDVRTRRRRARAVEPVRPQNRRVRDLDPSRDVLASPRRGRRKHHRRVRSNLL